MCVFVGHEEQLIPFSLVQMVGVFSKRPVVFSPSILSRGIIERLLQPAQSGLDFNTCHPGTAADFHYSYNHAAYYLK